MANVELRDGEGGRVTVEINGRRVAIPPGGVWRSPNFQPYEDESPHIPSGDQVMKTEPGGPTIYRRKPYLPRHIRNGNRQKKD